MYGLVERLEPEREDEHPETDAGPVTLCSAAATSVATAAAAQH